MYIKNKKSKDYFFVTTRQKTVTFNCVTIKFKTPEQEWRGTLKLLVFILKK